MSEGGSRDPWDLSRLGDEDFISEPLPSNRSGDADPDLDPLDIPPDSGSGRRLSSDERDELRRQARARKQLPPEYFGQAPHKRRWPRWGGVAVLMLVIIIAGNWRIFGGGNGDDPPPTSTAENTSAPTEAASDVAAIVETATIPPTATTQPTMTPTPPESVTPPPEPTVDPRFEGEVICLDPGHGGSDPGYTREANAAAPALREADINLENAKALKERLEAMGFTVVMTRTEDVDVNADGADVNGDGDTAENQETKDATNRARDIDELQARINICNNANAELMLSMHINGYPESNVSGYETWWSSSRPFRGQNHLIASLIFDELGKQFAAAGYNVTARQVNDDQTANVGVSHDVFDTYVITGPDQPGAIVASAMPGAIIETLFVSNDQDAAILASDAGREAIVTAYANGIAEYFNIILGNQNGPPESSR